MFEASEAVSHQSTHTGLCVRGFSKQTVKQTIHFLHETVPSVLKCVCNMTHTFLFMCNGITLEVSVAFALHAHKKANNDNYNTKKKAF